MASKSSIDTSIHANDDDVELDVLDRDGHATSDTGSNVDGVPPALDPAPTPLPWRLILPVLFLLAAESFNGVSLFSYLAYVQPP
jgi:hypothetical protein